MVFKKADSYYNLQSGETPRTGTSFQGSIYYDLFTQDHLLRLFVGLNNRYFFTEANRKNYSTQAIYPSVRLGFWLFYASVGYTSLVFSRSEQSWRPSGLSLDTKGKALLSEVGIEFPLIPFFSLFTSISQQRITIGSTKSPDPATDIAVGFRIYFGAKKTKAKQGYNSFQGWRYPFGVETY